MGSGNLRFSAVFELGSVNVGQAAGWGLAISAIGIGAVPLGARPATAGILDAFLLRVPGCLHTVCNAFCRFRPVAPA